MGKGDQADDLTLIIARVVTGADNGPNKPEK
jgi:hypothetical protein